MDLQYHHTSRVDAVRCCYNDDGSDLIAVAGDHSVNILLVTNTVCKTLASFHIGTRITALAWSPLSISPSFSDTWNIQLTVAGANFGLHLLTKSSTEDETIFSFGGGLSGHHGKVNDMTFCGGTQDSSRYVATISDDKMLMVWDLHPEVSSREPFIGYDETSYVSDRPQPTAYVIAFPHPLTTICSHPSTSKDLLVFDCFGSIFLTDWRSDPRDIDHNTWSHSSLLELVEPLALSTHSIGVEIQPLGSIDWRRDTANIIGAVYGSKYSIWNVNNVQGGKPYASGFSFPEGGHKFKWCPTHPDYFAISTRLPIQGAAIHIHNINYLQAQPIVLNILPKPHVIQDFDFLAVGGIPRVVVAAAGFGLCRQRPYHLVHCTYAVYKSLMFSKLPQKLTAPFSLLGDEAKLAFPTHPGGIAKLATTRHIPEADDYWNQYFLLFDSASDVFSLITPHHIRRALLDAPENIATLIRVVTARLFTRLSDHTFPSASSGSVASFASSFIKPGGSSGKTTTKEVLNCLRILQRILPVVFEVDGDSNAFELEVLWKKEYGEDDGAGSISGNAGTPQFVIEGEGDDDESDLEGPMRSENAPSTGKQKRYPPSLGERLFSSIMDLLFCCGFTLPPSIQVDHHKIHYVIWEKGIGATTDPGPSYMYDSNKTEVLRLLLVLLSRQIYVSPTSLFVKPSLYSLYMVQQIPRRNVLTLLCSLLNTALNSSVSHDTSIGGMAGSMAGKLPYNHLVFKGEDPRSMLVATSFQILCVLLDFQSGSARDGTIGTGDFQSSAPSIRTNAFRYFVMKLHRSQDFEFIVDGVWNIFEQQMSTMNNLLPRARKPVPYINDAIILFWKMFELNKKFHGHLVHCEKSMEIVAYLLRYSLEIKDKPQQHGFCRAISYIIQSLSAEPGFGSQLTRPVKIQLPTRWHATGTAADFMVNAIYAIVVTTSGTLSATYPALLIALANSAPYFTNLTVTASTRLIQLFKSFANPLFLLSDEGHPRLLFFILEVLNSVALYHLSENANLIYGVLAVAKSFEDLGTFTLSRALRDIRRAEQSQKAEEDPKGKVASGPDQSPSLGVEKVHQVESEASVLFATNEPIEDLSDAHDGQGERHNREPEIQARSITLPNVDSPIHGNFTTTPSEKVRGKMKERRSISLDTNSSNDRITAAGVGRNGFIPTQEWVTSWQQGLPLDTVMLLISELLPQVQELQATRHNSDSTSIIVDFLSKISLKHVLPEPSAPISRRFMWTDSSIVWLSSLIWGEIYIRGMTPLGIWNATNVRLFYVKHSPTQNRQITDTVSNVVGGFLRRNTDPPQPHARP